METAVRKTTAKTKVLGVLKTASEGLTVDEVVAALAKAETPVPRATVAPTLSGLQAMGAVTSSWRGRPGTNKEYRLKDVSAQ